MAISVAVCVGDEISNKVVASLKDRIKNLRIGPGTDISNDMGPLITQEAYTRIQRYVEQGIEQGADLVVDGRNYQVAGYEDGFFVGGFLFDKVTQKMSIYTDEIFGPVLCIVRVDSLEEAMRLIDKHEYGNGTCIFTRDGGTARNFADNIQVGMVGVNVALPVPVASQSFGGWKRSLFGDLYVYGPDAVRFYTRRKTMTQRWPERDQAEEVRFAFPSSGS
jgi:malonate-semialdehyde dehydrogenase (acetylating)/methylmalonate-semialdehyde dehydrogenase